MYLIDGFNLIGAIPDMLLGTGVEATNLVLRLRPYAIAKDEYLILVFDGGKGGRWFKGTHMMGIWSSKDLEADDVLMARMELAPAGSLTLVSSDTMLRDWAKWCRHPHISSYDFYRKLYKWEIKNGISQEHQPSSSDETGPARSNPYGLRWIRF